MSASETRDSISQGKRVLVVGLARTGVVVSLFSAGYGATVTATDAEAGSANWPKPRRGCARPA